MTRPPRPRFAIACWTGTAWRDGRLGNTWEPLRGRRYPTMERASAAFDQLAWRHDQMACDGRIAPNQLGRFGATHRIVTLEDGRYPASERWLPADAAARPFAPGEHVVWTHSERHDGAQLLGGTPAAPPRAPFFRPLATAAPARRLDPRAVPSVAGAAGVWGEPPQACVAALKV